MELKEGDFRALVEARCAEPHAFLGMHAIPKAKASQEALEKQMVVRALLPRAVDCSVVCLSGTRKGKEYPLNRIEESDLFEGILEDESDFFDYQLKVLYDNGTVQQFYDPYAFTPTISEESVYLFNEGKDRFIHNKLGAHPMIVDGISGVSFSVWAPSAKRVYPLLETLIFGMDAVMLCGVLERLEFGKYLFPA